MAGAISHYQSQADSKSLTATCFTRDYGIHRTPISLDNNGIPPDYVLVKVSDGTDNKFDPRKDWDNWATAAVDPRIVYVKVERLVGTVYVQEDLPFIQRYKLKAKQTPTSKMFANILKNSRSDIEKIMNSSFSDILKSKRNPARFETQWEVYDHVWKK